jgi:hypothetical protein
MLLHTSWQALFVYHSKSYAVKFPLQDLLIHPLDTDLIKMVEWSLIVKPLELKVKVLFLLKPKKLQKYINAFQSLNANILVSRIH